nr:MAG TPA: hypothetical protein [Caudoviricetes sp.]DAV07157.1 MAG TPA: hypothetical protein [Caudoviricetes sp.]
MVTLISHLSTNHHYRAGQRSRQYIQIECMNS